MAQSLSKLYVNIVFHTKSNRVKIRKEDRKELYAYMGAIIKDNNSIPIIINGVEDYVHVFCVMSKILPYPSWLRRSKNTAAAG